MGAGTSKSGVSCPEARKQSLAQISSLLKSKEALDALCRDLFDRVADNGGVNRAGLRTLTKLVVDGCEANDPVALQELLDVLAPLSSSSGEDDDDKGSRLGFDGFVCYARCVLRVVDAALQAEDIQAEAEIPAASPGASPTISMRPDSVGAGSPGTLKLSAEEHAAQLQGSSVSSATHYATPSASNASTPVVSAPGASTAVVFSSATPSLQSTQMSTTLRSECGGSSSSAPCAMSVPMPRSSLAAAPGFASPPSRPGQTMGHLGGVVMGGILSPVVTAAPRRGRPGAPRVGTPISATAGEARVLYRSASGLSPCPSVSGSAAVEVGPAHHHKPPSPTARVFSTYASSASHRAESPCEGMEAPRRTPADYASDVLPRWSAFDRSLTPTPRAKATTITWMSACPAATSHASASTAFRTITPREAARQMTSRSVSPSPAYIVASAEARQASPQRRAAAEGAWLPTAALTTGIGPMRSWSPIPPQNAPLRYTPANGSAVASARRPSTICRSSTPRSHVNLDMALSSATPPMTTVAGDIGARGRALSPCPVLPPPRMSGGCITGGQRWQASPILPRQQLSGTPQPHLSSSLSATSNSPATGMIWAAGNSARSAPSREQSTAASIAAALSAAVTDNTDGLVPTFGRQAEELLAPWSPADTDANIEPFLNDSRCGEVTANVLVNATEGCAATSTSSAPVLGMAAPTTTLNGVSSIPFVNGASDVASYMLSDVSEGLRT